MATWPTLRTLDDVLPAWAGLMPVRDELVELLASWASDEPKRGPLSDLVEAASPSEMLGIVTTLLQAPALPPLVDPLDLDLQVQRDPISAYWRNRNGVDLLRERQKAGQPTRSQIRSLSDHANQVLFPEVVTTWRDLGERYARQVPAWRAWASEHPTAAQHDPAPTPKGPPSWH